MALPGKILYTKVGANVEKNEYTGFDSSFAPAIFVAIYTLKKKKDMRRWFILLAASLLSTNLTMLAKDVKGTVIAQKDGQPVMGAEVIVKGTEISTVTDVDGRFILEDVPDDAKKIQIISIGLQSRTERIPEEGELLVKMKREEKVVTPFVKAGVAFTRAQGGESSATKTCVGYTAGVGVSFALSHFISITPSVTLSQKPSEWNEQGYFPGTNEPIYGEEMNVRTEPLYLTVPVMFDLKLWTKNSNKIIISAGPYVGFGLGGQWKVNDEEGGDLFTGNDGEEALFKKFDAGLQLGIGGIIRHFYIGVNSIMGLTPISDVGLLDDYRNFSVEMCVGYYF